jgi:hypothetical protein
MRENIPAFPINLSQTIYNNKVKVFDLLALMKLVDSVKFAPNRIICVEAAAN